MFLTLKNEKKKKTIWILQIENLEIMFKCFVSGDDEFSEWSDVLKIMYTWGRVGFIIIVQGGKWGSKYSIFWGNILINDPYHKG